MKLEEVILRDDRVGQPAATTVPVGTLYFVTDEGVTERSNGTVWEDFSDTGAAGTGDFSGPGASTDNAIVRFDGTGGKTGQNSLITIGDTGIIGFPDGVRQTFNPDGTNAGLNVGAQAGNPGSPSDGDLWYNSSTAALMARINGTSREIGFFLRSVTTLTNAQIKALPSTPITLAAAPGAGFRNKLIACTLKLDSAAGGYTNMNAVFSALVVSANGYWLSGAVPNDNTTTTDLTYLTGFLGTAHTKVLDLAPVGTDGIDAGSTSGATEWNNVPFPLVGMPAPGDVDNKALTLEVDNNGSGDLTGGNAANTLKVTLYYAIEAV